MKLPFRLQSALLPLLITSSILTGCDAKHFAPAIEATPTPDAVVIKDATSPIAQILAHPSAAHYRDDCTRQEAAMRTQLAALLTLSPAPAIDVLDALNRLDMALEKNLYSAGLVAAVFPASDVREAAESCEQTLMELVNEMSLSRPLYDLLSATDRTTLSAIDQRYRDKTLENFVRAGVNLAEARRAEVKVLQEELVQLGQAFDRNIRESRLHLTVKSVDELAGLPQDFLAKHTPAGDGSITISTASPDYFPVMQYASNDNLRKSLYQLYNQRAPENTVVLKELLQKRYQLAKTLGFENYAQLLTQDKMIGSAAAVDAFIHKVAAISGYKSRVDNELLLKKLQQTDPAATRVEDWQKTYLLERVKVEDYDVDAQTVRQYFQYAKVRDGMFKLIEDLFSVQIKPWQTATWHESVTAYEMWDKQQLIGRFYLDMHPREGKFTHAAQFSVVNGVAGQQITEAALVCNFAGADNPNALLEHAEVVTFLHEFGHLIHTLFAGVNQERIAFSGIKTQWDFVEAPSQVLQEWVWDLETLQSFAVNDKGEKIPAALLDKMTRARNLGKGAWTRQQLFYAALSLNLHTQDPTSLDPLALTQSLQAQYSPYPYVEDTHFYNSFGHLNGYSAMYYTYLWSSVIAQDLLSEFTKAGLRDTDVATRFRNQVLAPGGQQDAADLVRNFLGRDYTFEAFSTALMRD